MATITTKETRAFNWANPGTLKVGDEIVETLKDGREVVFVVMDDGVIGLKNLLGYHRMNKEWTNEGGWLACDMRRYLNEEVIALLPDALIAAIKPRKFGKEEDKLWLFSEMEVFGEHDWTGMTLTAASSSSTSRTAATVSRSTKTEMRAGGGSVLFMGAAPTASACEQRRRRER